MISESRLCDYCRVELPLGTHWRRRFCSDTHRHKWWGELRLARVNLQKRIDWARSHYWSEKAWHGKRAADRWLAKEIRALAAQAAELGVAMDDGKGDKK